MSDVVLYVSGGAMSAVFAAGVLQVLHDEGFQERFSAIYGVSAGALNAAFFASGQPNRGYEWYTRITLQENLIRHQSVLSTVRGIHPFDLGHAHEVLVQQHLLDVEALKASKVPVLAKVVHAKSSEISYIDVRRDDAIKVLCASAAVAPFATGPIIVDDEPYVDGAIGEPIGIERLRRRHPKGKFVIITNSRFEQYSVRKVAQWALMRACSSEHATLFWDGYSQAQEEIIAARTSTDCFLIEPPKDYSVLGITTEREALEKGFVTGKEVATSSLAALKDFLAPTQ